MGHMSHHFSTQERALLKHLRTKGLQGEFSLDDAIAWTGFQGTNPTNYRSACVTLIESLGKELADDGGLIVRALPRDHGPDVVYRYVLPT